MPLSRPSPDNRPRCPFCESQNAVHLARVYIVGRLEPDTLTAYTGEIAGLFTSLCWSFTSIFFTLGGRIVGSPIVNRTRLIFALIMAIGVHFVTQGQFFPLDAGWERWGWLGLSGILGFALGDACLFQAFVMIGPRLSMLMMALHPVIGTILAWDEWTNVPRKTNLGWVHLWEIYQQGAENNNWSLSAVVAMRGGFKSTEAKTAHTMILDESSWFIPGLHATTGDRFWSTAGALARMGIDIRFVNQIEEMSLAGDENGYSRFLVKCGQNKASMSRGERDANLLKKVLNKVQDLGVRLIS